MLCQPLTNRMNFLCIFNEQSGCMRVSVLFALFVSFAVTAVAQKLSFVEPLGAGYTAGTNLNSFSSGGNGGGFAFETAADLLFHDVFGAGLGFAINEIRINGRTASVSPIFADFKLVAR
jgi:hypothetical protein